MAAAPTEAQLRANVPRVLWLNASYMFLIVMPVVAILLMGLQRVTGEWPPRVLAIATLAITVVLVLAYLFLT